MTRCLSLLTLLGALSLGACAVGPDYQRPAIDAGDGWSTDDADKGPVLDLHEWWRSFGDADLDRLVARALEQNLDLRQSAARIREARALRDAAAGGHYPAADARAAVTRRRQSENGPLPIERIPGIERDQTIYDPGFDAAWELDLFGRTRRAVQAADERVAAAVEHRRAAQMTVTAEVARNYLSLRGAQHELAARREAIVAARRGTDLVRLQLDAGDVPQAALAQAEAELAALEARLPLLEAEERAAVLSLGVLLGDLPESELELADTTAAYLPLVPIPVGKRADLLRRRPDVRAAEHALAAATADVGVNTAELFPRIAINASGGFQSLDTGNLFESGSETWSVTPLVSWHILSGGRIRARVHASEARAEVAALEYEKAIKLALSDAEQALARYNFGLAALERQQAALAAVRQSYGYAEIRYAAGDISLIELLAAERALRDAEDAYARTHTQTATQLVALYKALGGGWRG